MSQLTLNYEEITAVAPWKYLREKKFKRSARESYFVPLNQLLIREGFNKRLEYTGIEELADSILKHGLLDPLHLDILEDGRYFIEKGHRRFKAFQLLLSQGHINEDHAVEFYPNKRDVTELQRMINQITSNNLQHPLKPIEMASVVHDIKYNYGKQYTHEELAEMVCVSRQTIDNLIKFAEAPDDVRLAIKDMKYTKAVEYIREEGKRKKQASKAEEAAGQSSMYVQPDQKDVNADELKELNDIEKNIALNEGEEGFVDITTGEMTDQIPEENKGVPLPADYINTNENGISISPSVITEPVAQREKDKFDMGRPEIALIQNIIKLLDKVEVVASRIPDSQASKDICDPVNWMRKDAIELRDWVHSNKKQNKIR